MKKQGAKFWVGLPFGGRRKMAAGYRLLAVILRVMPKTVYRYPSSVYRPSHRMTNEVLTHGSRSTVIRSAARCDASVASSHQLTAGSDLTRDTPSRYPPSVYRLPLVTYHDK